MLQKDPHRRPSIKKFLEKDFLSSRISNLLSATVAKHEFGRTFETNQPDASPTTVAKSKRELHRRQEEGKRPHTAIQPPERSGKSPSRPEERKKEGGKYEEVISSLQKAIDKQVDEDEDFNDEQIGQTKFNFVTPEGIPLPNINPEDSAFTKIENLRFYLE